jgi:rsbT co-antagonist protein RsbR
VQRGSLEDISSEDWSQVKEQLSDLTRARALAGFSPAETAMFVFSLKQPLFARMRSDMKNDPEALAEDTWRASVLLDKLGLHTAELHQQSREEVISRQQRELLELSTPVVELWDDIVALPLVGTLDSNRTQIVMETLLQKIVDTGAAIAIIDITGVPTVDTLVAQHLLKTVAATRLMGADCIISGIRPQIAQTIVHLGVNLGEVTTKATLADAFQVALKRTGAKLERQAGRAEAQ